MLVCKSFSQVAGSDFDRITIHPIIPKNEYLPAESSKLLETKLYEIISKYGIADNEYITRFVITAKVNVVSKDIVVGPPQRISQRLDVTFIIGDIEDDKVFATVTIPLVGIGQSMEKSFIAAFRTIKTEDSRIDNFMQEGKKKIIQYFEIQCNDIINESKKLSHIGQFEQSLILLSSVPNLCESCYAQCVSEEVNIYTEMINTRGASLLREAQTIWAQNPNREGAIGAARLLSQIDYYADCQNQVTELLQDITSKMNDIDKREWEFEMQQYRDKIEKECREREFELQKYKDNIEKEQREWEQQVQEYNDQKARQASLDAEDAAQKRLLIKACRDVAIEYAKRQPTAINYYTVRSTRVYHW